MDKFVLIAGTPKSGSSTVFSWLGQHLGIVPSKEKETRFFLDPDYPLLNGKCNIHTRKIECCRLFEKPLRRYKRHFNIMGKISIPWDYVLGYLLKTGEHVLVRNKFGVEDTTFSTIYDLKTTRHPKELTRVTKETLAKSDIRFPRWFLPPLGLGPPSASGFVVHRCNGDQSSMFKFFRQVYRIW